MRMFEHYEEIIKTENKKVIKMMEGRVNMEKF